MLASKIFSYTLAVEQRHDKPYYVREDVEGLQWGGSAHDGQI